MKLDEFLYSFFKPEVRKQGLIHFLNGKVFLKIAADTQVQAIIKGSSNTKVQLTADSIASTCFNANCSCAVAGKGKLCSHIWATLLAVQQKHPNFLDSKKEIHKTSHLQSRPSQQIAQKEKFKAQQADYRKQQYQKQKLVKKQKTKTTKFKNHEPDYPDDVKAAIQFFSENGFIFSYPINATEVKNAWKVLSKVFHPDKGGTHTETLLLNKYYMILIDSCT